MRFKHNPEDFKREQRLLDRRDMSTTPEIARFFKKFPELKWEDVNNATLLKLRKVSNTHTNKGVRTFKTLSELQERGIILTLAITLDGQIYERATRLQSGPSLAYLEIKSGKKWILKSPLKFDQSVDDYKLMLLDNGWIEIPLDDVFNKGNKDPNRKLNRIKAHELKENELNRLEKRDYYAAMRQDEFTEKFLASLKIKKLKNKE